MPKTEILRSIPFSRIWLNSLFLNKDRSFKVQHHSLELCSTFFTFCSFFSSLSFFGEKNHHKFYDRRLPQHFSAFVVCPLKNSNTGLLQVSRCRILASQSLVFIPIQSVNIWNCGLAFLYSKAVYILSKNSPQADNFRELFAIQRTPGCWTMSVYRTVSVYQALCGVVRSC